MAETLTAAERGALGGRPYIGPKAQTAVYEPFFSRVVIEASDRRIDASSVWREVIYAGLRATGRASLAECRAACAAVGIDPASLERRA